jgi:ABC-type multidrug transport system fused ATPase/permease subunit
MVLSERNASCAKCLKQGDILWRTLKMLRPYYGWVGLLLGIMVVGVGLDLLPNLLIRYLLDDVLDVTGIIQSGIGTLSTEELTDRKTILLLIVCGLFVASLARQSINIAINRISADVGTRLTYDVRTRMFTKLTQMTVDFSDRTQDFGEQGKVLLDIYENRFVIPDVSSLRRAEREKLTRYIYW